MGDERSREMYQNRIDYSNGAKEAIERIVRSVRQGKDFIDFMRKHQDHLYIFGAGMLGQDLDDTWNWKFGFQAFIDLSLIHI